MSSNKWQIENREAPFQQGLRGADAVYAAVAALAECVLVTLDQEQLARLSSIVTALSPAAVLADLRPLP